MRGFSFCRLTALGIICRGHRGGALHSRAFRNFSRTRAIPPLLYFSRMAVASTRGPDGTCMARMTCLKILNTKCCSNCARDPRVLVFSATGAAAKIRPRARLFMFFATFSKFQNNFFKRRIGIWCMATSGSAPWRSPYAAPRDGTVL